MNVTISGRSIRTNKKTQKQPKHTWLEEEDRICAYLYLHGKPFHDAHRLLPHIQIASIKMKFQNCLFLDKGKVKGSMAHCSKQHIRMFTEQREILLSHILSSSYK
jgi:hypothetical protein